MEDWSDMECAAVAHMTWRNAAGQWPNGLHTHFSWFARDVYDVEFLSWCVNARGYYIGWKGYTADGGPVLAAPHPGGFMLLEPPPAGMVQRILEFYAYYLRYRRVWLDTFVIDMAHCIRNLLWSEGHMDFEDCSDLVNCLAELLQDKMFAAWITNVPYAYPQLAIDRIVAMLESWGFTAENVAPLHADTDSSSSGSS